MKLVMIGHGMVGHKFIEAILEKADDELEITILAEEPRIAYDRVHLTEYFSGKSAKDLSLARFDFADAHGIDLRLNTKAIAIDAVEKTVTTSFGDVILLPIPICQDLCCLNFPLYYSFIVFIILKLPYVF